MAQCALDIVRHNGRYYVECYTRGGNYQGLGQQLVECIPSDPKEYQEWLSSMRISYSSKEAIFENYVNEICYGSPVAWHLMGSYVILPTALPRLNHHWAANCFIVDLDAEVLTMNSSVHWKLNNLPRKDMLWMQSIRHSIYHGVHTVDPEVCPEEHIASLDVKLPGKIPVFGTGNVQYCTALKTLDEPHKVLLASIASEVIAIYSDTIVRFGRQWQPDTFPFRELIFAILSVASDTLTFHSFPPMPYDPRGHPSVIGNVPHLRPAPGWFDKHWAFDKAPLLDFGSMSHRQGQPPGAAPPATIYWMGDVLVSLSLVVDGPAITEAMEWGLEQKGSGKKGQKTCPPFQMMVISLFQVAFAEVSWPKGAREPVLRVSENMQLSPLEEDLCFSSHPHTRPVMKPNSKQRVLPHEGMDTSAYMRTTSDLYQNYPGIAAMVHFFDTAARRSIPAASTNGPLPLEIHDHILEYIDYDTWRTCSKVSSTMRDLCMAKYRFDDNTSLIRRGPSLAQTQVDGHLTVFYFRYKPADAELTMVRCRNGISTKPFNFMPIIGSRQPRTLLADVNIQFNQLVIAPPPPDTKHEVY